MPILQGWTPQEYVTCAHWLPLHEWPDLVGIGSVCRRSLHGSTGLLAVLDAVDAVLPEHVRLHLFGVKSQALEVIAGHPRIASVDSMAWDMAARAGRRTGRTAQYRAGHMQEWFRRQSRVVRRATGAGRARVGWLPAEREPQAAAVCMDLETLALEALALCHAELLMDGDLDYRSAVWDCVRDGPTVTALVRAHGGRLCLSLRDALDEVISGLAQTLQAILEGGDR